jgi:hypothetical protein
MVATLKRIRRSLYWWAIVLGDIIAFLEGNYIKRTVRKKILRQTGRATNNLPSGIGLIQFMLNGKTRRR